VIRLTFGTVGAGGGYDDTKCNLIALISYESTTSLFISSCILTLVTQSRQRRLNLIPHLFGVSIGYPHVDPWGICATKICPSK
jgi:hypothetical protein